MSFDHPNESEITEEEYNSIQQEKAYDAAKKRMANKSYNSNEEGAENYYKDGDLIQEYELIQKEGQKDSNMTPLTALEKFIQACLVVNTSVNEPSLREYVNGLHNYFVRAGYTLLPEDRGNKIVYYLEHKLYRPTDTGNETYPSGVLVNVIICSEFKAKVVTWTKGSSKTKVRYHGILNDYYSTIASLLNLCIQSELYKDKPINHFGLR